MLGLRMWSEHTGDARAAAAAEKMADLVCNTFLDTGLRVFDAGSHEMNMGIIHGAGAIVPRDRQASVICGWPARC